MATRVATELLDCGIYVIGFSYPVVPKGQARIRCGGGRTKGRGNGEGRGKGREAQGALLEEAVRQHAADRQAHAVEREGEGRGGRVQVRLK